MAKKMKENIEILNNFILLQESQYKIIEKVLDLLISESETKISKENLKFNKI